ncbi:alpha-crystallin B chain-like [Aethina tumida]|uniref:alpha-crystallin B chain-like n=1 Tax=Aethina tumida TaxID=116153 RepID=UPI0021484184|nr:alpha-crystallin B chain-like [Aethina tumida]
MSLFPYVLRDMMRPLRMMENHMRLAEEMFRPVYINGPRIAVDYQEDFNQKDKFQVRLDVQDFKPEEITVKTIDGNAIQIEAKHEEKKDEYGFISRQFVRKFVLPQGHDLKGVVSTLSSDGVLTVTAPKVLEEPKVTEIPITHVEGEKTAAKEEKKSE